MDLCFSEQSLLSRGARCVPAAGEKLVQLVYEALDTATAADTAHQEDLAARRVLDKAHIKVCVWGNHGCGLAFWGGGSACVWHLR
jgi:hypothetical protein